jgi:hypothetical protein
MLFIQIFIFFCLVKLKVDGNLMNIAKRIEVSSQAIVSMVEAMNKDHYIEFDLHIIGNDKNVKTIANKIIKKSTIPWGRIHQRSYNDTKQSYGIVSNKSAILLSQFSEYGLEIVRNYEYDFTFNPMFILAYCPYDTLENYFQSEKVFITEDNLFNLAHTKDGNMTLIGNEMVSQDSCEKVSKTMNTFYTSKMKWNSTKFIAKYKNFYKCDLVICYGAQPWDKSFLVAIPLNDGSGKDRVSGFSTNLISTFKEVFNYGNVIFKKDDGKEYCKFELFFYKKSEFIQNESTYNHSSMIEYVNFMKYFSETYPVYHAQYVYIVTKGQRYTEMEKLFLPFDTETWIMIMITFVIGFLTILIVYRCKKQVQRFVFGTFIRDPSWNLTSIFFGMAVTRLNLPGRNFSRYLFMIFSIYCLIIRTAYQGTMYEFMNIELRKQSAKTIDDFIDMKIPLLKINDYNNDSKTTIASDIK